MAKQEAKAMSHDERVAELEALLEVLVGIRERSVGLSLKRTNYRIAEVQNEIRVAEKGQWISKSILT
jgi:hypothetical protein